MGLYMILSLSTNELKHYISNQLNNFFPDSCSFSGSDIDSALDLSLERTEFCFRDIKLPQYSNEQGQAIFSHLHSDQYSQFLYFLSNSLWNISQNKMICDKLIFLNKMLNGMFYSYKCKLPAIFLFVHPVGTIIGNADYSDFLVILQNVTVNTDCDENGNAAPVLGKGLFLGAGSKIIGNKPVGERVSIGVNAVVHNTVIPDDSLVINKNGVIDIVQRKKEFCTAQQFFKTII